MSQFSQAQDSLVIDQPVDTSEAMRMWNSEEFQQQNINTILRLQQDMKDRRAKEKKSAMIKIGFGIAMLVLLIVGLRRKKKAASR
jgi:hypothetical protein